MAAYGTEDIATGQQRLAAFMDGRRVLVMTGAGCSTASGIPDYRDANGDWRGATPIRYQAFVAGHAARQRYWARSMLGWPRVAAAQPGPAHIALARLQRSGYIDAPITQNVDGLHGRAGNADVIDLHGLLDRVICLDCGAAEAREPFQWRLRELNPDWGDGVASSAPDGDAAPARSDYQRFAVPACACCGGRMKPDVVFFGENVPRARVETCFARLDKADALLVVGSSLMVRSGFRFVEAAARDGKPVAALNMGRTRADHLLSLKVEADCGTILSGID